LLIFATVVWFAWMVVDSSRAATTAIAVLVVSCPCALSLATPAALAAATGELLKSRLLITRGHALETLAKVSDVVFDKTGTVTTGQPAVESIKSNESMSHQAVLDLAVAMEMGSTHPYANALREEQRRWRGDGEQLMTKQSADATSALALQGYEALQITHEAGHGVSARLLDDSIFYLGSARWCGVSDPVTDSILARWRRSDNADSDSASEVVLSFQQGVEQPRVLARFLVRDALRQGVRSLITDLKERGIRVHLLSGDRLPAVRTVAAELAIGNYRAAATPEDKQAYVAELQDAGKVVLMVGDGINDAPVLASANVSMAAGDATALARTAADVISLLPGLDGLPQLLGKSRQTVRIVRQNLAWAASYNTLAIPLAATGYVPPWAAAIGMALSSLLVAGNAQRLYSKRRGTEPLSGMLVSHP